MFSQVDKNYMRMALNEARNSYLRGDLPVGAVLTIDDHFEGSAGNSARTDQNWVAHAENSLLQRTSWKIKSNRNKTSKIYTSWEPCLMCTGASVLSRVSEVIYACPDPLGGMSTVDPSFLGEWNKRHWPNFREGPFKQESYNLLRKYMEENKDIWEHFLEGFIL